MKAKRIFLAVLLTAALSVSSAAPAVLAESPAAPEVTTITVFRPNLGEEDYMGLQSVDGETLLPPAFASIEVVGKFAIVYSDETDSFYLYDWQKRAFVAEYPMMYTSGDYIVIAESWEDGNYGLLDQSGAVVTEMQWLWMGGVADDVVWVAADEDTMRVNLLHIPSGEMLLDEWADYCTEFSGGYSGFVRDGHVFFVDAEGNVQETSFVSVKESRIDGCFEVQTEDGVTGYYQPQKGRFYGSDHRGCAGRMEHAARKARQKSLRAQDSSDIGRGACGCRHCSPGVSAREQAVSSISCAVRFRSGCVACVLCRLRRGR